MVITAITLGLFGGLFCCAFFEGMADRRVDEALSTEIGHIQIHHPSYQENPEMGFIIPDLPLVDSILGKQSGIQAWSKRIRFQAMIASSSTNSGVTVVGIDPENEKKVSELYQTLLTAEEIGDQYNTDDPDRIAEIMKDSVGHYFEEVSRNPIFIGEELAIKLNVKVRSKLVLTFQNAEGQLTGASFRVCGIFRTENSLFEEMHVFVRMDDIHPLTGLQDGTAHELVILLNEDDQAGPVADILQQKLPGLEVADWKTLQPDIAMLNDMMTVSMTIIMIIILLALGFGIVNTMLMVVLERVRELGMLMAVGMQKGKIFAMIILESVLLCLTGGVLGMILSFGVIELLRDRGLDMTGLAQEGFEALGFGAVFYPSLGADFYAFVTLLVILTGILSSVYPAWKALKLNPAEALRTE